MAHAALSLTLSLQLRLCRLILEWLTRVCSLRLAKSALGLASEFGCSLGLAPRAGVRDSIVCLFCLFGWLGCVLFATGRGLGQFRHDP